METLGGRIRALRRERGMPQREVAQRLGVDFTYISKIENDRVEFPCSQDLLRRMADLFDADSDELIQASGRCPDDIVARLAGSLPAIKAVRAMLALVP